MVYGITIQIWYYQQKELNRVHPAPFEVTDKATIEAFIAAYPFAILTSMQAEKIEATHLPINRFSDGKLYAHVAKANPHAHISPVQEVCLIFNGPHAYISPNYYQNTQTVPTWNYAAVHIYGKVNYIDDVKTTWKLLEELIGIYEGKEGWALPKTDRLQDLTAHIRFIEITETRLKAKFKFNQNKSPEDRISVIEHLKDNHQKETASFMEQVNQRL